MPMDGVKGNDIFKSFELSRNQRSVGYHKTVPSVSYQLPGKSERAFEGKHTPRTRIGDIEMVSIFLRRELGTGLPRDPVPEDGLAAFELPRLVIRGNPIGDFSLVTGLPGIVRLRA